MTAWSVFLPPAAAIDLMRERQGELDQLFAQLPLPSRAQASGTWKGSLMALRGLGWLPRPLGQQVYRLLALPINPWQGKRLDRDSGDNCWLHPEGLAFGHFRITQGPSPVDGQPALLLDYDVTENPALLRRIRGEARLFNEEVLLARMNWQTRNGQICLLYFTLSRVE